MNTITIELCKEDRQRLDEIIGFLGLIAGELKSRPVPAETATAPQAEAKPEEVAEFPIVEDEPPFDVPAPEKDEPQYTLDDVRAVVQRLIAPGSTKRAQAKAIVEEYATKISAIPVNKFSEVMDRLTALEKRREATDD